MIISNKIKDGESRSGLIINIGGPGLCTHYFCYFVLSSVLFPSKEKILFP